MTNLPEIVELSTPELDAVAGGQAAAAGGLVNVALNAENIDVLRNANINVLNGVTITDIASHNNVSVGAIITALGGGSAILQRQTTV
jgi:hypothetical protein